VGALQICVRVKSLNTINASENCPASANLKVCLQGRPRPHPPCVPPCSLRAPARSCRRRKAARPAGLLQQCGRAVGTPQPLPDPLSGCPRRVRAERSGKEQTAAIAKPGRINPGGGGGCCSRTRVHESGTFNLVTMLLVVVVVVVVVVPLRWLCRRRKRSFASPPPPPLRTPQPGPQLAPPRPVRAPPLPAPVELLAADKPSQTAAPPPLVALRCCCSRDLWRISESRAAGCGRAEAQQDPRRRRRRDRHAQRHAGGALSGPESRHLSRKTRMRSGSMRRHARGWDEDEDSVSTLSSSFEFSTLSSFRLFRDFDSFEIQDRACGSRPCTACDRGVPSTWRHGRIYRHHPRHTRCLIAHVLASECIAGARWFCAPVGTRA
jgi:hypothetical protein